jgi:hypothetical protein
MGFKRLGLKVRSRIDLNAVAFRLPLGWWACCTYLYMTAVVLTRFHLSTRTDGEGSMSIEGNVESNSTYLQQQQQQ